jgi:hypothetical protein
VFELDGKQFWLLADEQGNEFTHHPGDFITAKCPSCCSTKVLVDGDTREVHGDSGRPLTMSAYWALCDSCSHTWSRAPSPDLVAISCEASLKQN